MSNNLCAVLDIGSNTIRLLIAEAKTADIYTKIHYQHHIARLGQGLQQSGQLSDAGMQRALLAFQSVVEVCQSVGIQATAIVAVATAAVREASNGKSFVAQVFDELGLRIHIISGEQEAKLALKGAVAGLSAEIGHDMLLFDIGGGSTEFTRVCQGQIKDSLSMKLGVVRLTETHLQSNPPTSADYQAMKSSATIFLDQLEHYWADDVVLPKYLVGTAGSVTTLAAIVQDMTTYDASKIDGFRMSENRFQQLKENLLVQTNEERLVIPALEQGREDVIVAGLAIIDMMFERWDYDALIAVDSGLLEGLLHFPSEQT